MATRAYTSGLEILASASLEWVSGDIRVLMIDNSGTYTFDPDHDSLTTVAADEMAGTGYERIALTEKSLNTDMTNDQIEFLADPVTWTDLDAGEAQAIVVYLHVGASDGDNIPISYHDGGFPKVSNGEDFTVSWGGASNNRVLRLVSPSAA